MIEGDSASMSMKQCLIYAFNIAVCCISPILSAISQVLVDYTLLQGLQGKL